ncbi:dihydrofolate reductase family protein [Nocardia sp. 2]|uniref:Dihydrofolate reductase family protein n=1 Tax=Nocardia acididurans TaxID=2802282 RepID=A0ABS1MBP8_9NOCA|nr:dihydrofolate reductase family protein [Nocardia acididurans]MBL1077984.1 dihydrofolate reductase family protein [Nocardia acididurans]
MSNVVVVMHMSIDGVVERHNWTGPFHDEQEARFQHGRLRESRALLLGRVAFEELARAWRAGDRTDPYTALLDRIPKYVVSRTLEQAEWNSIPVDGDIVERVAQLRAEPGRDLLVLGGLDLVNHLVGHELVDEIQVIVHPLLLGAGRRVFAEVPASRWQLTGTQVFRSGVVALEFRPQRSAESAQYPGELGGVHHGESLGGAGERHVQVVQPAR